MCIRPKKKNGDRRIIVLQIELHSHFIRDEIEQKGDRSIVAFYSSIEECDSFGECSSAPAPVKRTSLLVGNCEDSDFFRFNLCHLVDLDRRDHGRRARIRAITSSAGCADSIPASRFSSDGQLRLPTGFRSRFRPPGQSF